MAGQAVDLHTLASTLHQPFLMHLVGEVDHFALYLYRCEGFVARHTHPTQDELFHVVLGSMTLDTDWGQVHLSQGQFAVVPRGVSHVSGAVVPAFVLLAQAKGDPDRRNGHARFAVEDRADGLPHGDVRALAERIVRPRQVRALAQVDEMSLRAGRLSGDTPWHFHGPHDELLCILDGHIEVEGEANSISVHAGQLLVIPRGRLHRLRSPEPSIIITLVHREVTTAEQLGE
jgi:quercetin dioxygenase-like cupin family protein